MRCIPRGMKPKQGSQVLIQHGGGTELATLRGKSLITEDGEAIEGEAPTMLLSSAS